jgi:hypothetical protein
MRPIHGLHSRAPIIGAWCGHFSTVIKEIVSHDFEVCFLVPLKSSDIATSVGTGSFKKKVDFVLNF